MKRLIEDGNDAYVVMLDDAVLGWINYSRAYKKWRALTASGKVSFHFSKTSAYNSIA